MISNKDFFETILILNGKIQNVEKHIERILRTLNFLETTTIDSLPTKIWIQSNLKSKVYSESSNRLRIDFSFNNHDVSTSYIVSDLNVYPETIKLSFHEDIIKNSNDLSLRYKVISNSRITTRPASDYLFINEKNEVCETSKSNFYLLKNEVLITPPLESGVLAGTYRAKLLSEKFVTIQNKSYPVKEHIIMKKDLTRLSKIFVSNALMGLKKAKLQI